MAATNGRRRNPNLERAKARLVLRAKIVETQEKINMNRDAVKRMRQTLRSL